MKDFAQVTLLVAFLVVGNAGSVFAQQGSHFQRVTTTASSSGARSPSARSQRSTPARDVQAPRAASRVAECFDDSAGGAGAHASAV